MGAPTVLLIDAASFLVAAALVVAFVPATDPVAAVPGYAGILAGLKFLARDPFLRRLTAAQVLRQTAFQALVIALPVLAFVHYGESPGSAGLLLAAWGGGALVGSAMSYVTSTRWDLVRTGEAAWLLQALPLWLLAGSVPAGVPTGAAGRFGTTPVLVAVAFLSTVAAIFGVLASARERADRGRLGEAGVPAATA